MTATGTGRRESSEPSPLGAVESPRTHQSPGRARQLALALGWVLVSAYVFHRLNRNWIPHDDGALAQGAERVLRGELPHRDFAEVYTGGLDYLNALGFKVFGVNLMSLRYVLFGFVLVWVPVVYYCALRFVAPLSAAAVTLLSVLWTVPNYPAAMPSWYNLFFGTFGVAALLRFAEVKQARWLVVAGLMGGCSILAKISGLYYVAPCLLFLVVHEALTQPTDSRASARWGYKWLVALGLLGFVAALFILLRGHLSPQHVYHFLIPGTGLALLTWWVIRNSGELPALRRFGRLVRISWPFLLGLTIPIAAFAAPYAASGGVGLLLRGIFVSPTARFAAASVSPLEWPAILPAGVLVGTLVLARTGARAARAWLVGSILAVLAVAPLVIGGIEYLYRISWVSISRAIPLVVAVGLIVLARRAGSAPADTTRWEQSFLLVAVAGLASLIEFPYSAPIYFCYTAPLALLALISVLRLVRGPPQPWAGLLTLYYAGFAIVAMNRQSVGELGLTASRGEPLARLELSRGRLLVHARDAAEYRAVVDTLTAHAHGSFTYAGPDAPEIYFLAGLRNPTRTFFDFLEPAGHSADRVLAAVDQHGVTAVVINRFVKFSAPLAPDLEAAFAARFPHAATIGRFTVRWR